MDTRNDYRIVKLNLEAFDAEEDDYVPEYEEFAARDLSTREILEQALHMLAPVKGVAGERETYRLENWAAGEWVSVSSSGYRTTACSIGAMALVCKMDGLSEHDWAVHAWADADPEFHRALLLLAHRASRWVAENGEKIHAHPISRYWLMSGFTIEQLVDREDLWRSSFTAGDLVNMITSWNDYDKRTSADVLEVFTDAIKAAVRLEEKA